MNPNPAWVRGYPPSPGTVPRRPAGPPCKGLTSGLQARSRTLTVMISLHEAPTSVTSHPDTGEFESSHHDTRRTALAGAGERMLVVVAHPDDETFGCGSIIAVASEAGAHVTVACATLGDRGETRLALSPEQIAHQRRRELHLAADVLGVHEVVTFA